MIIAGAACGGGESRFVGSWVGIRKLANEANMPTHIQNTLKPVNLEIKSDGTFKLEEYGIPSTGDVAYQANKALLTVKTQMNRALPPESEPKPLELEIGTDGTAKFRDPAGFDTSWVIMKRKEKQPGP